MTTDETIAEQLKGAFARFGHDIVKDKKRFEAVLKDELPLFQDERGWLVQAANRDILAALADSRCKPQAEREVQMKIALRDLQERAGLSERVAGSIVAWMNAALGAEPCAFGPEETPEISTDAPVSDSAEEQAIAGLLSNAAMFAKQADFLGYTQAFNCYEQAAALGSAEGWYQMGEYLLTGKGALDTDVNRGCGCIEKAAGMEHKDALRKLGYIYLYGNYGKTKDVMQGFSYIERSGEPYALNLARRETGIYFFQSGDFQQAKNWFLAAMTDPRADVDCYTRCALYLAEIYWRGGNGIARDTHKARQLIESAVAKNRFVDYTGLEQTDVYQKYLADMVKQMSKSALEEVVRDYRYGFGGFTQDSKKAKEYDKLAKRMK